LIGNQRRLAEVSEENSEELRLITEKSLSETRDLITLNAGVIVSLEGTIQALEQTGGSQQDITSTKSLLVQARSANNQLVQGLRSAEFQADPANPPSQLASLQKETALNQLKVQEKALDLSLETSRLQLVLAQVSEATMYPAAPFDGVVEKVHVVIGQTVAPGTPLVTLAGTEKVATAVANVPYDTAQKVSNLEESTLYAGDKQYNLLPDYVSKEATNGLLNSVIYTLPDEAYAEVTDGEFIKAEIPIGIPDTLGAIPYIPIDIVFQTQDGAYVYVADRGAAKSKKVVLGDVVGSNVAVSSGLAAGDQVILDRNIIEGEKVKIIN
jgi:hypothetical protein